MLIFFVLILFSQLGEQPFTNVNFLACANMFGRNTLRKIRRRTRAGTREKKDHIQQTQEGKFLGS